MTALSTVFVVCETVGCYDDRFTLPVRVFPTKEEADRFCQMKGADVARLVGMHAAVCNMLGVWDKEHPSPEWTNHVGEEVTPYDKWQETRYAEEDRLQNMTGYTIACNEFFGENNPYNDPHDVHYHISEVPVG